MVERVESDHMPMMVEIYEQKGKREGGKGRENRNEDLDRRREDEFQRGMRKDYLRERRNK